MELKAVLQTYQNDKIAIYGLSPLTQTLLEQLDGCHVLGLLDGYQTSGNLYGKSILSMEEAVREQVRLIIVAARPESCKVIAKRIETVCAEHGITLVDIHGEDLRTPKKAAYSFSGISGASKEMVRQLIDTHDAVSADLFDTLLMRRTLFPADVFEIVGLRLKQKGIVIDCVPQKRLEGEKELGKTTVPTLLEIYSYILERYSIPGIRPEELARLEWETDRDLVVPRKELCTLLREAHQQGKPVYIVSDTFYTKDQLAALLNHCGITFYTDILASCDYRTGKTQGLFTVLRQRIPEKHCVHIGDSIDADIKSAERSGYTACQLFSGLELFEKAGYLGLWENIHSLSSRIQTGMLAANLFNSPFQFEEPERKIHVADAYDIGYLFLGPVITGFVIWLYRQMRQRGLKNIWFCARDGYLIKKLYDQLDTSANSVYFLTSRFAAIRAGIEDDGDIHYVESMRFSGSLQEQLRERFGISVEADAERGRLLDYREEILKAAEVNRKNYLTYLQNLETAEGEIAFCDFSARGTVQMYVQRLLDRHLKGLYFSQLDPGYMEAKGLEISPFYSGDSGVYRNFYVLEAVITAPQPSVFGFDENGDACFVRETRSDEDLRCIQRVQDGAADYFEMFRKLDPEWESLDERSLGSLILSLVHKIEIQDRDFLSLTVDDPFFHRVSNVSDLV